MYAARRAFGFGAVLIGLAIPACADGPPVPYQGSGMVTVGFLPKAFGTQNLTLGSATMRIGGVLVLGNVPPPPPPQQPPPQQPPPQQPPPPGLTPPFLFDALSSAGSSQALPGLPQGLYSRVEFLLDRISLAGTWKGTPFRAALAMFMLQRIDLRSSVPQELGPAQDVVFSISVDPGSWFGGALLDGATIANGEIVVDDLNNGALGAELTNRIAASFVLP